MTSNSMTAQLLSRKQINYAVERCKRIAARKKNEIAEAASKLKRPELTDYDKVMMIRDGIVPLDVSRVKPDRTDRYYNAPRLTDCGDFSKIEAEIASNNKAVDKSYGKVSVDIERRADAIIDKFELGSPAEALQLLEQFEAQNFSL